MILTLLSHRLLMIKTINGLLFGLLFLWVPLAFFTRAQDGFTLAKEVIAVSALLFLIAQAFFIYGKRIWNHGLVKWVLFFLAWMAVDSLTVGLVKTEVFRGLAHIFMLAGVVIVVIWNSQRGGDYNKLVHYCLFSGGLMALYGLVQAMGLDQSIAWDNRFDNRVFSTLGNPNYLGGHFAALLPVAFVLGLRSTASKAKWFWLGLTGLLFTGLLATRVRGADLAFAGSFGVMGILLLLPMGRGLAKRNLPILLSFLLVFFLTGGLFIQRHGGLSSFGASEVSVQQRLETYKVTWEIIKANPWFGIGLGQLGTQYPLYQARPFQPSEYPQHPYTYTEHVHNEFLQFLAEGGWPGLLLFLVLLMVYASAVSRFFRDPQAKTEDKELMIGIMGGAAAVFIQSLSNFPLRITPTILVFGLWLAAPMAMMRSSFTPPVPDRARVSTWVSGALTAVLLLIGVKALAGSVAYRDTVGETSLKNYQNAVYFGQKLTALTPGNPKAWLAAGKALEGAGRPQEAQSAYEKAVEWNSSYVEAYMALGLLQLQTGQVSQAVSSFEKAETIAPNYAGPIWFRALGLFQLKQYELAARAFESFLILSPDNAQAYSNLGVCYIQSNRKVEAVQAWKKALSLNPGDEQVSRYLKAQGVR